MNDKEPEKFKHVEKRLWRTEFWNRHTTTAGLPLLQHQD